MGHLEQAELLVAMHTGQDQVVVKDRLDSVIDVDGEHVAAGTILRARMPESGRVFEKDILKQQTQGS